MEQKSEASVEVLIIAEPERVWQFLTEPALIAHYRADCTTFSSWKEGEPIIWTGSFEGKTFRVKGVIQKYEAPKVLIFSYFDSRSNLSDLPENYVHIQLRLSQSEGGTRLSCQLQDLRSESEKEHLLQQWKMIFSRLKVVMEESAEVLPY